MEEVIRMADDKNVGGILLAFLAGSVVGAALGLLFAPSSGAESRQKIKSKSLETRDRALEKVETVKSEAAELVERGKEKVAGVRSQIQAAVDAGKEAYAQKKSKLTSESEEK
jgi:gas vesicle protein